MQNLKDKKQVYKRLAYLIMFDGGVYHQGKHCKFIMNHASKQFIDLAAHTVQQVTGVWVSERKDYNTEGYNRKPQWRLESKPHPVFTKFRERLYHFGYKSLDSHWLKAMDAEALALMYMADGSLKSYGKGYLDVYLNTKRLTEGDNKLLANYLKKRLDIDSAINRQGRYSYLRIANKSQDLFFQLVAPYMLPDFYHKLPPGFACDVPPTSSGW